MQKMFFFKVLKTHIVLMCVLITTIVLMINLENIDIE